MLFLLPSPSNLSVWWNFGSLLRLCLVIQIVTVLFLSIHYTGYIDLAFESVIHYTGYTDLAFESVIYYTGHIDLAFESVLHIRRDVLR